MRNEGRRLSAAARTTCRCAVAACGVALAGCIVPTPEHGLHSGWGAIDEDVVVGFAADHATRADVLLRLGEPFRRRDDDGAFVYEWEVTQGYLIAPAPGGGAGAGGGGVSLRRRYYAAIRFDERGTVTASTVVAPRLYYSAETDLEDWLRAAAAEPDAGPRP